MISSTQLNSTIQNAIRSALASFDANEPDIHAKKRARSKGERLEAVPLAVMMSDVHSFLSAEDMVALKTTNKFYQLTDFSIAYLLKLYQAPEKFKTHLNKVLTRDVVPYKVTESGFTDSAEYQLILNKARNECPPRIGKPVFLIKCIRNLIDNVYNQLLLKAQLDTSEHHRAALFASNANKFLNHRVKIFDLLAIYKASVVSAYDEYLSSIASLTKSSTQRQACAANFSKEILDLLIPKALNSHDQPAHIENFCKDLELTRVGCQAPKKTKNKKPRRVVSMSFGRKLWPTASSGVPGVTAGATL
jgi:hypothetical protein